MDNTHLTPDQVRTSKRMAHTLRHNPGKYGLSLDEHGFAPLEDVLAACRCTHATLDSIMSCSDKPRFEVVEGRIRATHGHTIDVNVLSPAQQPPDVLYHGTTTDALPSIMANGLSPMRRQHVHLHESRTVAEDAAKRFHGRGSTVLLEVDARSAYDAGITFHPAQGGVWLSGAIPPDFIRA